MTRKVNAMLIMAAILCSIPLTRGESIPIDNELQSFAVKTGATRLIYLAGSKGASLTVMNPQSYPMLVKTEVVAEDRKTRAQFIVTPPLLRLDGHQQSRINVIATSNHDYDSKETLNWLCLTGIPPDSESDWTDNAFKEKQATHPLTLLTHLRIKSCLKLIVRPAHIKGTPDDFASSLNWVKNGTTLTIHNPTPFFMNLRSVQLGKVRLSNPEYVPPMSERVMSVPADARGPVHWRLITDYGGDSGEFTSDLSTVAPGH